MCSAHENARCGFRLDKLLQVSEDLQHHAPDFSAWGGFVTACNVKAGSQMHNIAGL